ncbi:putative deacetylase LmbE-like domain-containing protein [Xylogone sp. PMI_703]|nr:putative deacetylase LmbE-like domain-containing protein [Xylogone sp. PMI_703]
MQSVTLLAMPVVVVACWLYTVGVSRTKFPTLKNKKICLLIAHPDDEAMFFAPTLLALTAAELGNHIKILCLSSGNADGLGETRKKELVKSGLQLGLRKEEDVFVVDSPDFQDSMTLTWDKQKIASLLTSAFAPDLMRPSLRSSDPLKANIDVLITFDGSGVSSHPNHISLYHGARTFIAGLTHNRPGWSSPVDLYTLTSVNIARKYSSFLDSMVTLAALVGAKKSAGAHPSPLYFLSGPGEVRVAQSAMTTAHVSQMRWFRWGWIGLSRYMVLNDLRLEKVSSL